MCACLLWVVTVSQVWGMVGVLDSYKGQHAGILAADIL